MRELTVVRPAPPTQPWVRPGRHELAYRAALAALRAGLRICTRTERVGLANIPAEGPVIVVGNHISMADGVVLVTTVAKAGRLPRMMGTAGLFRARVLGWALRHVGYIPVYRRSANPASALGPAQDAIAADQCIGLYPEGAITRLPDHWPARARTGVVRLALDTGAPVVPVAQWGTQNLVGEEGTWHRVLLAPFRRPRIEVAVGRPIDLRAALALTTSAGATAAQLRQGADLVMDELCSLLEILTGQERPPHAGRVPNPLPATDGPVERAAA
ncbi:MAG: 1-acyl-sn-glycerol-3-phosphate acyltransferase [Actinomycetota bacterium]|nr:1-acyl-sn-glycerol-3-phosphate acyltransferase [Actinomycetota bacterium]